MNVITSFLGVTSSVRRRGLGSGRWLELPPVLALLVSGHLETPSGPVAWAVEEAAPAAREETTCPGWEKLHE